MNTYQYNSILKDEIYAYLNLRASQGHKGKERYVLHTLDAFLTESRLSEKCLAPHYIDEWINSFPKHLNVNTKAVNISHYTQFAKYLHSLEIPAFIPERPRSNRSYIPYIFSQEEIDRMFEAADSLSTIKGFDFSTCIQFPMLMRLLYGCGLRLGEALALKISDVDFEKSCITIRIAKENKERLVSMDASLSGILENYCKIVFTSLPKTSFLFENRKHGERSHTWTRRCFHAVLECAEIEIPTLPKNGRNICVHCLRHTFAVNAFRQQSIAGVDSYAYAHLLSVYMGHADLLGTETYLHMTAETGRDIYDKMAPYSSSIFPEVPK